MNIILTNAPVKNGNRGCVALSVSTMYLVDKILSKKNIPHTFYLPQSGYAQQNIHTIKVGDETIKFISLPDITPLDFKHRLKNLLKKDCVQTKDIYKNADFILDIGQGDSFADIYGKRRFDWIFSQYRLGMKYHKPYCILPQTIGPFNDSKIREQAKNGIEYTSCVMVRDKQSYDYVKELLPEKEVTEIIDVAFFMPFKRKTFDKSHVHVGLNISALLWYGGYTRDNQFGLKTDYQSLVRDIIKYFLAQDGITLHLIPHVVGADRGVENDYAVSFDLCEEFNTPNLVLSPLFLDPISAKNYIAGMDFFMGARMHSTIAAFSSGVPVMPMAYSRKFNGLFADTLQYTYVADMKVLYNSDIINVVKDSFGKREELKRQITERMGTVVKNRKITFEKKLIEFLGLK